MCKKVKFEKLKKPLLLKILARMCKKVKFEKLKKPLLLKILVRMCKKVKWEAFKKASPKSCLVGCPSKRFCGLKALL